MKKMSLLITSILFASATSFAQMEAAPPSHDGMAASEHSVPAPKHGKKGKKKHGKHTKHPLKMKKPKGPNEPANPKAEPPEATGVTQPE